MYDETSYSSLSILRKHSNVVDIIMLTYSLSFRFFVWGFFLKCRKLLTDFKFRIDKRRRKKNETDIDNQVVSPVPKFTWKSNIQHTLSSLSLQLRTFTRMSSYSIDQPRSESMGLFSLSFCVTYIFFSYSFVCSHLSLSLFFLYPPVRPVVWTVIKRQWWREATADLQSDIPWI